MLVYLIIVTLPHGVVMDLCDAGTPRSYIDKTLVSGKYLSELSFWNACESLVEAVHYYHLGPADKSIGDWNPMCHRDIIRGNILLDDKNSD